MYSKITDCFLQWCNPFEPVALEYCKWIINFWNLLYRTRYFIWTLRLKSSLIYVKSINSLKIFRFSFDGVWKCLWVAYTEVVHVMSLRFVHIIGNLPLLLRNAFCIIFVFILKGLFWIIQIKAGWFYIYSAQMHVLHSMKENLENFLTHETII